MMNAKNLQYDTVFVNLDHKPEWLLNYSPKGNLVRQYINNFNYKQVINNIYNSFLIRTLLDRLLDR